MTNFLLVPDPPTHIKAERINQRQIKVTWSLPRRSTYRIGGDFRQRPIAVTGFRIYYAAHGNVVDPTSERILEVGAVTMATVDDVSPTESYIIKIQSRGIDKRFGNWSDPVIVSASRYGNDAGLRVFRIFLHILSIILLLIITLNYLAR